MNSPEAVDVGLYLLRGLQDNGFDSRTMATEIGFGIRDTSRGNGFVSLICLGPKYLYFRYPFKSKDLAAMRAFRERANLLTGFFDPDGLDDRNRFSKQPQYRDLAAIKDEPLKFVVEERDQAAAQLQERE